MEARETILPAPPPAHIALWAEANARWARFVGALSRLLRAMARRGLRALAPREPQTPPVLAGEGGCSLELGRWVITRAPDRCERASAAERATVVQVRRMG